MLDNVAILILLFLRDPELKRVKSELQLVHYLVNVWNLNLNDDQIEKFTIQLRHLQICILLDGYDEYPSISHKNSLIAKLFKRMIFPKVIVLVTSRPTATLHLHDKVDRRIGFHKKNGINTFQNH